MSYLKHLLLSSIIFLLFPNQYNPIQSVPVRLVSKSMMQVQSNSNLSVFSPISPLSFISSSASIDLVILSQYDATVNIGDSFYLTAITSNGKPVAWKSSSSKIATVNSYGKVTAKSAGTIKITAKIKNAEASCQITVNKTKIVLNRNSGTIERGVILNLSATTSTQSPVLWKSSKRSVASVDEYGKVTALKPGESIITATADGSSATCVLTVKSPTIQLDKKVIILYRGENAKLSAEVSSHIAPTWKTHKKSVAIVDQTGQITAIKNGVATISVKVDGVSKSCQVIVLKPEITLGRTEVSMKKGSSLTLSAKVSSNNVPVWTSSNSDIVSVDSNGKITALKKGTANIYASEDGTKERCRVHVTE